MVKRVICPGSFDPVTRGHIDIINRASKMFDHVIVAVLVNSKKRPVFTIDERIKFIENSTKHLDNVEVVGFEGMLAEYAKERNAMAIIKGLRAVSDFEYEFQMALANKQLNPDLETIFLTANQKYMYLSSSIVREIASLGGEIDRFVPEGLSEKISKKLNGSNF